MVEGTKDAPRRRWVRWLTLGGSISVLALAGVNCTYDKDNRCGDDLVFDEENEICVCPPGTLYSPTGCTECGEHEILQGAACVCEEGYTEGSDGTCQEDTGSGGTGNTSTTTAGDSGAGGEGGEGTTSTTGSTAECTVNDDCASTEVCDAGACRVPTGWRTPCTTSDECEGFEAGFCDSFQMACTVADCTLSPDSCPSGFDCCDLTAAFGAIMCIPAGYCL